ncbi:unnamed protein product [Ectocarpus fasciculatus]
MEHCSDRTDHRWPIVPSYFAKGGPKMSSLVYLSYRYHSAPFLHTRYAPVKRLFLAIPYLKHSLYLPSTFLSHVHFPLLVQRAFRNYMNTAFALPAAITFEVVVFIVYSPISSSTFSKANVPGPEFDLESCPCIQWSM